MTTTAERQERVRSSTALSVNQKIDAAIIANISEYAAQSEPQITERIRDLQKEWDTERILELNASILAFTGLMLGIFVNVNWLWLPGIVLVFLAQHAIQGWCPPLFVIRRLGVRTRDEISSEKFALKALRGDFSSVDNANDQPNRVQQVIQAVGL